MALTTVAKIKTHLGITGSDEDAYLTQLLAGVEPAVLRYLNRRAIESATVTEYFHGHGRSTVVLNRRPVTAVASVNEQIDGYAGQASGAFGSETLLTAGEDYWVDNLEQSEGNPAMLMRVGKLWPNAPGSVKVVYTAGYTTVPLDIELAVHLLCGVIRSAGDKSMPLQSENLGSYSYQLLTGGKGASSADLMQVQSLLGPFREVAI